MYSVVFIDWWIQEEGWQLQELEVEYHVPIDLYILISEILLRQFSLTAYVNQFFKFFS